jgi:hypothetical protein
MVVRVSVREGAWTPSPHCAIEAGPEIELNVQELAWLVEEAGPTALDALRYGTRELAEEAT